MRTFKFLGALMVVMAFSAIAVATASAAEVLWHFLPGANGTKFTGDSGKSTLQVVGGLSITSPKSTSTGELTSEGTLGTTTITFKEATTAGLPVNSEGDASGIIKVKAKLHNCLIAAGDRGVKLEIEEVKLVVPSTKLTVAIKGALIVLVSPFEEKATKYALTVTQKEGKQGIEKCEGGTAQTLLTSIDKGTFTQSAQESKEALIDFAVAQTAMA